MLTLIDGVRYGTQVEQAGQWQEAAPWTKRAKREAENCLAPARGAIWGLALSAVLWVGIVEGVRALLSVM
jgi:hypothetical protein